MNKIYDWYGSRPIETNLSLIENDSFWRPRGKLIWGCPSGIDNNWYSLVNSIKLDVNDPFFIQREERFKYHEKFLVNDISKILTIDKKNPLDMKYVLGTSLYKDEFYTTESYLIDFTKIKNDGYKGIEIDFESYGGIPTIYYPWSVSSIAVWDSSIITIIKNP